MRATHRPDIFTFAAFDPARDLDFNGYFIQREGGNILVDPVAMIDHDRAHAEALGGVAWIIVTNSDHVRDTAALAEVFSAKIAGPAAERESFPCRCDQWLTTGSFQGLEVLELDGSKTPGELCLIIDDNTLITGDLIRAQRGGTLNLLPAPKLADPAAALSSVKPLAARKTIEAVLVGDGWPLFSNGHTHLARLIEGRGRSG